jgi:hypothetical protein
MTHRHKVMHHHKVRTRKVSRHHRRHRR